MPYNFLIENKSNYSEDPSKKKPTYKESLRTKLTMDPKSIFLATPPLTFPPPPPPPPALKLIWQDITILGFDATNVNNWNLFFYLPPQGTPFTSVEVIGNEVKLFGGSNIDMQSYQFKDGSFTNANLISIIDEVNCIISLGEQSFAYQPLLETVLLPAVIYALGQEVFAGNYPLKNINLRSCIQLGESVGNDGTFNSITNQTITLTIPSVLMTCNAGNPDGDIQYLQANNNVIITTV